MGTTFTTADIAAFEHATWSRCAPGYEDGFAVLTRGAVEPLLDRLGVTAGKSVLDIGTGTGVAATSILERGGSVVGIDFSEAMIAEARRRLPEVDFRVASAEALPFDDGLFDAVVANGVLHHLAEPDRALEEAQRVLNPAGRIGCTVWAEPETLEAFGVFFAAVEEHAGAAELPHGPLFGVTDSEALSALFVNAGFSDVTIERVPAKWRMNSVDVLLRAFGTWAQLDTFPRDLQTAIEDSVRSAASAYESGDGLEIPNPMLLIAGTKAD